MEDNRNTNISIINYQKFLVDLKKFSLTIKGIIVLIITIVVIEADGNCLFRSVSDQIEGHSEKCDYYRQEAVIFIYKLNF